MTAERDEGRRGAELLLEHCAVLERLDEGRQPVGQRLEQELGGELARLLVRALAGDHYGRLRALR